MFVSIWDRWRAFPATETFLVQAVNFMADHEQRTNTKDLAAGV